MVKNITKKIVKIALLGIIAIGLPKTNATQEKIPKNYPYKHKLPPREKTAYQNFWDLVDILKGKQVTYDQLDPINMYTWLSYEENEGNKKYMADQEKALRRAMEEPFSLAVPILYKSKDDMMMQINQQYYQMIDSPLTNDTHQNPHCSALTALHKLKLYTTAAISFISDYKYTFRAHVTSRCLLYGNLMIRRDVLGQKKGNFNLEIVKDYLGHRSEHQYLHVIKKMRYINIKKLSDKQKKREYSKEIMRDALVHRNLYCFYIRTYRGAQLTAYINDDKALYNIFSKILITKNRQKNGNADSNLSIMKELIHKYTKNPVKIIDAWTKRNADPWQGSFFDETEDEFELSDDETEEIDIELAQHKGNPNPKLTENAFNPYASASSDNDDEKKDEIEDSYQGDDSNSFAKNNTSKKPIIFFPNNSSSTSSSSSSSTFSSKREDSNSSSSSSFSSSSSSSSSTKKLSKKNAVKRVLKKTFRLGTIKNKSTK